MKNEILNERNFVTTKEFCEIFDRQILPTTVTVLIRNVCSPKGTDQTTKNPLTLQ